MQGVAAVEDVETFARAAAERFLARMMCDRVRAGVETTDNPVLAGKGALSLVGASWRREVVVVDLDVGGKASVSERESAIVRVQGRVSGAQATSFRLLLVHLMEG